jgi:hypothetical protein
MDALRDGPGYPARADSTGMLAYAKGGAAKLRLLQVYDIKPISGDRLTS